MKREKRKEKTRILKQLYINGCSICGSHKDLVYHHIIPSDKLFGITTVMDRSTETFIKELDKCVLLCHKCHIKLGHEKIPRYIFK